MKIIWILYLIGFICSIIIGIIYFSWYFSWTEVRIVGHYITEDNNNNNRHYIIGETDDGHTLLYRVPWYFYERNKVGCWVQVANRWKVRDDYYDYKRNTTVNKK